MKKIYIRSGIAPFEPATIGDAIQKNLIGQNSGNLIYQYSVFRTLMCADTRFYARYDSDVYDAPGGVERLNEECSCAVLPLANVFRPSFPIRRLTDMIRRLKIPCVIVGCGLQAKSADAITGGFPFDDDAREFVRAALEKSAMLGLRGEYTAAYLQRLGFAPERHFTVIGCPSLYVNGARLPEPEVRPISADTRFSINTLPAQNPALNDLILKTERQFPGFHLVLQDQRELAMLAFGTLNAFPDPARDRSGYYPFSPLHRDVRGGRVVGFTEARTWFDYIRGIDYSFGSRLHGNLAAVVNGTPAFVFTSDTRTEEICRYANIPHAPLADLAGGADIRDVLEGADFKGVCRGYEARFAHFVDFLNANGLDHIYRESLEPQRVPFDEAMGGLPMGGLVRRGCLPWPEAVGQSVEFYRAKLLKRLRRARA